MDRPGGGLLATGGETSSRVAKQALEFPVGRCAKARNQVWVYMYMYLLVAIASRVETNAKARTSASQYEAQSA